MSISAGTATPKLEIGSATKRKHRTLWGDAWVQFRRNRLAVLGLTLIVLIVVGVLAGPFLYPVDPKQINILEASAPPSMAHPFGTDDLGRDMLARCIYGGRISLSVGMAAMLSAMLVGATGGWRAG